MPMTVTLTSGLPRLLVNLRVAPAGVQMGCAAARGIGVLRKTHPPAFIETRPAAP